MAKIFAYVVLILIIALSSVRAEVEKDEGVLVLTDANFDEELKSHDKILVEFYAPWCGHCKKLAPEYVKAAEALAKENPPIYIAKVDATVQKELAAKYEIKGFPTLKWFVNQQPTEYKGGRTADEIINWIKKKSGPATREVTGSELNSLKESTNVLVAFFGDASSNEFKEFQKTADADDKSSYVHAGADAELPSGASRPGVVVFRKFDEPYVVFSGKFTNEEIQEFVSKSSVPSLIEFSDQYIEPIFQQQKPALFLFINKADAEHAKLLNVFTQASKELKGKIFFSHSGVKDGIQQRLGEFVGVSDKDLPRLMIVGFSGEGVDKYVYSGNIHEITVQDIDKFVTGFTSRTLSKFLKSEEIPTDNEGPVRVVVGKNFNDIVGKDDDVLLEFYAPWCGHCKALEPKYKELAEELKSVKGLVIAKCDATANEVDGIHIQGFPTIKFFKKNSKTPADYEGEREIEGFKKYLLEHSEAYKASTEKKEDL
jgi:protein disulfide-isomerase A1